jgi:sortase A
MTTLVALSACVVASSPSATSPSSSTDDTVEVPESADDDAAAPESTPEPEIEIEESEAPEATDDSDIPDLDEPDVNDDATTSRADDADELEADEEDVDEPVPGKPVRFQIDAIDVDAAIEYVGVDDDGNMDVPQEWENVAWYEPGTVPGDRGNSVIAGHYDSYTDPAVFYDLNELEVGDIVRVITEDGEEVEFEITELELVHVDDADTSKIFGNTDERNLNLITCEGAWDPDAGMYDERLIVYTTLVSD